MPKLKSIVVRSGQKIELSDKTIQSLGGTRVALRPRTPDALRTLLAEVGKKPARLHDEKSFDQLKSQKGHLELTPAKHERFQGLSISTFKAIVRALPAGAAMPKSVQIPRLESGCGCKRAHNDRASRDRALASNFYELPIPDWLQKLLVFRNTAFFQDIVVESGGLLVINQPTIAARNFVLHSGGRVRQEVSVVIDLSGGFRAGEAADA